MLSESLPLENVPIEGHVGNVPILGNVLISAPKKACGDYTGRPVPRLQSMILGGRCWGWES